MRFYNEVCACAHVYIRERERGRERLIFPKELNSHVVRIKIEFLLGGISAPSDTPTIMPQLSSRNLSAFVTGHK